jgi:3-isopropylmalate/(R)-2-methylmalate dehydratase small subunit
MNIHAKALVIHDDNIDTDVLYPGQYLNVLDPEEARSHLFEGLDPKLRDLLNEGDTVLFVGENFGCGSSREQPATAMAASGVRAVIGKSFARIFARNCVNAGMPAYRNANAVLVAKQGDDIEINIKTGVVKIDGQEFPSEPLQPLPKEILDAGGMVPWIRKRLDKE